MVLFFQMGVFSVPELKCEIARLHETLEQSTEALGKFLITHCEYFFDRS